MLFRSHCLYGPALVWSALPDGSVDFVNRRLLEYTGLPLEEVEGWGWTAALHPEDRATFMEEWRAALAAGEPFKKEARLRRADGEYRWFLWRTVPLRDELGSIVKWYGTTTGIEDRKRAEEALRRSEVYLAEAQRLSRTGSFGWNVSAENFSGRRKVFESSGTTERSGPRTNWRSNESIRTTSLSCDKSSSAHHTTGRIGILSIDC